MIYKWLWKTVKVILFTHFTTLSSIHNDDNIVKWAGTGLADTRRRPDADSMPAQRLWCWTNTETAPGERTRVCRVVMQRTRDIDPIVHRQCRNIKPPSDQRHKPAATTLITRGRPHLGKYSTCLFNFYPTLTQGRTGMEPRWLDLVMVLKCVNSCVPAVCSLVDQLWMNNKNVHWVVHWGVHWMQVDLSLGQWTASDMDVFLSLSWTFTSWCVLL